MANLERYFLSKGHNVGGYDRTPSELTDALRQEAPASSSTTTLRSSARNGATLPTRSWSTPRPCPPTTASSQVSGREGSR